MAEPKACDVIRHKVTGDVRVCLAVCDDGRWSDKRSKDKVWVSQHRLVASGAGGWTNASDWEIAWPGHGWAEKVDHKRTQKELDEMIEGGGLMDELV